MKIGLLGFGVVGKGFFELAFSRNDLKITKVFCRRNLQIDGITVTQSIEDILQDEHIDTVVELIGGLHPAYEYVKAALEAGKNVVTANKALLANYYDELLSLAAEKGVSLRCTAAVGGGISWLSELERTGRTQSITQVRGIMNGTCNYILDSMTRLNLGYADALGQAQNLGYAEADPTADVEGFDTWHKLVLSANIAFGISLQKESVPVRGISQISAEDVQYFKDKGYVCKLIATAKACDGKFAAYVQPTLCPIGTQEAAVPANYNFVTFCGSATGTMSLYGQGAGRYPTAHNVLQDCVDVCEGKGFYGLCGSKAVAENDEKLRYYVRTGSDVTITEPMEVSRMHAWLQENPDSFAAALPME